MCSFGGGCTQPARSFSIPRSVPQKPRKRRARGEAGAAPGLPAGLGAAARRWDLAWSRLASPRNKAERGSRAAPLRQTRVPRGDPRVSFCRGVKFGRERGDSLGTQGGE